MITGADKLIHHLLRRSLCDGLWNPGIGCGCGIDDLAPCRGTDFDDVYAGCIPAYRWTAEDCRNCEQANSGEYYCETMHRLGTVGCFRPGIPPSRWEMNG